ncbi:hypothetical protein [Microcoleus sp. B4-D4]|uniref:hypothetical protein n=1 Tax=Microcoleus sp. B4-D4 TaxID=2818667 RepID=UPI002FD5F678
MISLAKKTYRPQLCTGRSRCGNWQRRSGRTKCLRASALRKADLKLIVGGGWRVGESDKSATRSAASWNN